MNELKILFLKFLKNWNLLEGIYDYNYRVYKVLILFDLQHPATSFDLYDRKGEWYLELPGFQYI